MKEATAFVLATSLGCAIAGVSMAADTKDSAPLEITEDSTSRSTVVTINNEARTVTLKGADGKTMDLTVDPGVTRFDALKVGDVVVAGYTEHSKFEIQPKGTPVAPDSVERGGGKFAGDKPGGAVANTSVRTVIVTAIDAKAPSVTFKNADGGTEVHNVRHPEYLSRFKVGDQVRVSRTKAILMKVEAAK